MKKIWMWLLDQIEIMVKENHEQFIKNINRNGW